MGVLTTREAGSSPHAGRTTFVEVHPDWDPAPDELALLCYTFPLVQVAEMIGKEPDHGSPQDQPAGLPRPVH
jgi:hypothetical protein